MIKQFKIGAFGKTLIKFASSQLLTNALRIVSGFLVVMFLDPLDYGKYTAVGVFLGYILLSHVGIINGLGRELPYEIGQKNISYAEQLASSTFSISVILGIIAALFFIIVAIKNLYINQLEQAFLYFSYSILAALHLLNKQFLPVLYRTNKDFNSLSRQYITIGLFNLLSVLFVYGYGFIGLIIRGLCIGALEFYLLFKYKPSNIKLKMQINDLRKLFKTGLPNFLVGQINPLWVTISNNFIVSVGGSLNFGLYSLSTIMQSAFGIIPNAFSQIVYPKMSIAYGEGKSIKYILRSQIKPLFFQFFFMLAASFILWFALPYLVQIFLPKYNAGIKAAQWMLLVPVVQSFGALNNMFNVAKKQFYYILSYSAGALIGILFTIYTNYLYGFDLEYISIGILIGSICQQVLSLISLYLIFWR